MLVGKKKEEEGKEEGGGGGGRRDISCRQLEVSSMSYFYSCPPITFLHPKSYQVAFWFEAITHRIKSIKLFFMAYMAIYSLTLFPVIFPLFPAIATLSFGV